MDTFEFLARGAEAFIGVFNAGGKTFVGFVTGILPTLIVLLTAVYTVIGLVGEERVHRFASSRPATSSRATPCCHCWQCSS